MTHPMTTELIDYIEDNNLDGLAIAAAAFRNLDGVGDYERLENLEAKITREADGEMMCVGVEYDDEDDAPVGWTWATYEADGSGVDMGGDGIDTLQSSRELAEMIATTITDWAK